MARAGERALPSTPGPALMGSDVFGDLVAGRRLLLLGGRGGVGKSTLAAALARALDEGEDTLLLGTDPARTLPRILRGPDEGDAPGTTDAPGPTLRQVDGTRLRERFQAEHGETLASILHEGTYLLEEDARALGALPLPGADELFALTELADGLETARRVIVDTAPSTHALRLLATPDTFEAVLDVLEAMREKALEVRRALAGEPPPSDEDRFLRTMREKLERVRAALRDPSTGFIPVLLPEASAVAEARRMVDSLRELGVRPVAVVLNALPGPEDCCDRGRARTARRTGIIRRLGETFDGLPVVAVPRIEPEPVGPDLLDRLGAELLEAGPLEPTVDAPRPSHSRTGPAPRPGGRSIAEEVREAVGEEAELVLVGGKGGVGKSTVAAALAVQMADDPATPPVLAVSLADRPDLGRVLAGPVTGEPRPHPDLTDLSAVRVDARARFERIRAAYREDVERALDGLLGGGTLDAPHDRAVLRGLLELAPPGIDEIVALDLVMDRTEADGPVVLDGPPTGHLLRFLEMPGVVREWLGLALRLLRRYPELGDERVVLRTVELLGRVRTVAELLRDRRRTGIVLVAAPGEVPVEEALRLGEHLSSVETPPHLTILNRVEPPGSCEACARQRTDHLEAALRLADRPSAPPLRLLEDRLEEPVGLDALRELTLHAPPEEGRA